jgi:hypothetical protein
MMATVQFESAVEGNLIRIPEEYINQIPSKVAVTLAEVNRPLTEQELSEKIQRQRVAFEKFTAAMAEIKDEPIDEEFEALISSHRSSTRELNL